MRVVIAIAPLRTTPDYDFVEKSDLLVVMDTYLDMKIQQATRDHRDPVIYYIEDNRTKVHVRRIDITQTGLLGKLRGVPELVKNTRARELIYTGEENAFKEYQDRKLYPEIRAHSVFGTHSNTQAEMALVSRENGMVRLYNKSSDEFFCDHWFHEGDYMQWLNTMNPPISSLCPMCK
jgi:hypothetical protein